jgi:hypothetical protein
MLGIYLTELFLSVIANGGASDVTLSALALTALSKFAFTVKEELLRPWPITLVSSLQGAEAGPSDCRCDGAERRRRGEPEDDFDHRELGFGRQFA